MIRALLTGLAIFAIPAHADEVRIYKTDKYGRIQYSQPSYTIRADGRVILTDPHGNKLYHKQQYVIRGNSIVPVNARGDRQYNRPALVVMGR